MWKKLLNDTNFKRIIKEFYKKHKEELLDIILFGSTRRGKEHPADIDLLLLCKEKEDLDLAYELKKTLKDYPIEITTKTYSSLFSKTFKAREAFLLEGYSLIKQEPIAEEFGFFTGILFKYALENKTKSERMRFYYALYGRTKKEEGILKRYNLIKFSDSSLLSPIENSEKTKAFLNQWNIKYKEFPILIPERLNQII